MAGGEEDRGTRVLSGIQPTGEIHIGNYFGAIENWIRLTREYECFYSIVDYHAITLPYEPAEYPGAIEGAAVSLLAAGLDPGRCRIFLQSEVPEHTELAWILTTLAPLGNLQRMTQFKDKAGEETESVTAGLLMYPVLQAADILLYKADRVPVGEDQVQHLELARVLARRFNNAFGETFPEPQPLLTKARRILGLDGQSKMSKSKGNHIGLLDSPETIREKMATAFTDPQRLRRSDPGRPWVCNVFTLHHYFSDAETIARVDRECRAAEIGCYEDKMLLAENMIEFLAPMRERAAELRARPERVREILEEGRAAAAAVAGETMREVREKMGLWQANRTARAT
ncbi:MAG TPA: tryptophan--tRNA ligase [Gemmatimonadota bacterium]|nr:tryptophan--tRNA ligase [Gemmatimonadota bacterium]